MTLRPSDIELAAIAAAWSARLGALTARDEPQIARWRIAGRMLDAHDAMATRGLTAGSAWRNAGRPR